MEQEQQVVVQYQLDTIQQAAMVQVITVQDNHSVQQETTVQTVFLMDVQHTIIQEQEQHLVTIIRHHL